MRWRSRSVSFFALVILVGGCTAAHSGEPSSEQPAAADVVKVSTPDTSPRPNDPGLDAKLAPVVSSAVALAEIPAAVVFVVTPSGSWAEAYGTRAFAGTDPVTVDDRFRVGSVTKTMVATVVLQLVEQGKLSLSDKVSKFYPEFPDGEEITIEQLLDMRSGLFSYTEDVSFNETLDDNPGYVWKPAELLAIATSHSPYFEPGNGFRYSNTNTVLVASIAQQVTGETLGDLLQERIFEPLGLHETSFPADGDHTMPVPSPRGYLYGTNVSALQTVQLPDAQLQAARTGALFPHDVTELDPSWIWAAGGVISTAADLATYARALVDGHLLTHEIDRLRIESLGQLDETNPATIRYGLGWMSFGPMIGHDGAIPGFQTFMGREPASGTTIVVFCTMRDSPTGVRPANEIAKNVFRALHEN
ncbi:serine hydrolase domain-containing protein [Antrihabitans stalactiti]|nr:beta-lactamase family protein [Antrihabitans stalactiti]